MSEELELREVAAAVIVHDGRVLVQTRPAEGRFQGWWEFPGGGREEGESLAECARRECLEEVGLAITTGETLHRVEWSYPGRRVRVDFLLCAAEAPPAAGEPQAEAREGQRELRWVPVPELGDLKMLPANAEVVALLRERFAD